MNYGKAIVSGMLGALLACVLWIVVKAVLPIAFEMARAKLSGGGGAAGASIDSNELLIAAVVGFAGGWYWRSRRRPR